MISLGNRGREGGQAQEMVCYRAGDETEESAVEDGKESVDHLRDSQAGMVSRFTGKGCHQVLATNTRECKRARKGC